MSTPMTAKQIAEESKRLRATMIGGAPDDDTEYIQAITNADPRVLIAALSGIGARGTDAWAHARRDAARSMLEYHLAERMIAKMQQLERASGRLGVIGIAVGVIIGVVGPVLQWWLGSGR